MAHYSEIRDQSVDHEQELDTEYPEEEGFLKKCHHPVPSVPFYRRHSKAIFVHSCMLLLNFLIALSLWSSALNSCPYGVYGPELVPTPAKKAISYEARKWDHTNTYFRNGSVNPDRLYKQFGPPSPEVEHAWENLIQYQNIRLSKDELGSFRDMPGLVQFADGSGYYATLSAYHSVHCVKRLHHFLHFDYYYSDKTEDEAMLIKHHAEHCLNILLQTVQCNPDLSIFPMQWGIGTTVPIGLDIGEHQCMNWKRLDDWMKSRSVDVFEPGLLVHPQLGEAYQKGSADDTGVALDKLIADEIMHDHGH